MINNLIKILLVDDQELIRKELKTCLMSEPMYLITGEASDGVEALQKVIDLPPDLILMDIRMPRMDGFDAAKRIKKLFPDIEIIFITSMKDKEYVEESIRCGAKGYLLKESFPGIIKNAIDAVMKGDFYHDDKLPKIPTHDYFREIEDSGNEYTE